MKYGISMFVSRAMRGDDQLAREILEAELLRAIPADMQPTGPIQIVWCDARDEIVRGDDWVDGWWANAEVEIEPKP